MQDWTPLGHALIALGVQAAACGVCVFSGLSLSAGAGAGAAVASALYYGREHAQEERRQGRAWYKVLIPDRTWSLGNRLDLVAPAAATGTVWLLCS